MARIFAASFTQHLSKDAAAGFPPMTVCAWFRPEDLTHVGYLFFLGDKALATNLHHHRLRFNGLGAGSPIDWGVATSGSFVQASTTNGCTAQTWHMATALVPSTSSRTVILDANVASQGTETSTRTPSNVNRTGLGARTNAAPAVAFNGRMAWVTVWNQVLTTDEITALRSGRNPLTMRRGNINACWPLFGWATPETDLVGSNALTPSASAPTLTLNGPPVEPLSRRLWTLPLARRGGRPAEWPPGGESRHGGGGAMRAAGWKQPGM